MMRLMALATAVLAASPAAAERFLNNTTLSIGAERHDLDMNVLGSPVSAALNGVYLRYEVDKDNGFETNSRLFYAEEDGYDYLESYFDVSWKWRDIIGPKVAYVGVSVDGFGEEYYLAGLTAAHRFGGLELRGDLMSDTDNFGDEAYVALGAKWSVNDKLTVGAEVSKITSTDISAASLTAKYDVNDRFFVEGGYASTQPLVGLDYQVTSVGIGFNF